MEMDGIFIYSTTAVCWTVQSMVPSLGRGGWASDIIYMKGIIDGRDNSGVYDCVRFWGVLTSLHEAPFCCNVSQSAYYNEREFQERRVINCIVSHNGFRLVNRLGGDGPGGAPGGLHLAASASQGAKRWPKMAPCSSGVGQRAAAVTRRAAGRRQC